MSKNPFINAEDQMGDFAALEKRLHTPPSEQRVLTIEEIKYLCPAVVELERLCKSIKDEGGASFCANSRWYGTDDYPSIKGLLYHLVGWGAKPPILRSMQAYSTTYRHLYKLLPDCRNCICY